jgi:uncharacterized protein
MDNTKNMGNKSRSIHRAGLIVFLATAIAMLGGCAGGRGPGYSGSMNASQARRAAEELAMRGDHAGAARQYLELSNSSEGPARNRYLILAARETYLSNDVASAERLLAQVGNSVDDINLSLWATVSAEIKLATQQPQQALNVLARIPASDPDANSPRVLLLQANALFQMGQAQAAVEKLLQRDATLRSAKNKAANQRNIYIGLQTAGESIPARPQTSDPVVNGWLMLGYITWQQRNDAGALRAALTDWRAAYPEHPAANVLVPELLNELGTLLNYPNRVALLLPLDGRQRATAEAVRDGFLAAHFAQSNVPEQPEVIIYDTSNNPIAAYEKALRDGADFVVGPLLKDAVVDIALYPQRVTTLALNTVADESFSVEGFYQYALSPEDEARQVARRAVAEGRMNALALVPDTDWGQRVFQSFAEELQSHGGAVLDSNSYTPDLPDYSANIRRLLLLDQGEARHAQINNLIGTNTDYEPRVREDADFIFLAANNQDGGMLRPQLRFYYAGSFVTYATSAIYQPGSSSESDLNGITFPDSPWVIGKTDAPALDAVMRTYWGAAAELRQRFYAMGHDAYRLLPLLNQAKQPITTTINGLSGRLSVQPNGRIERQLSWAEIRRGKPYPLAETPQLIQDNPENALFQ